MTPSLALTQSDVQVALRSFLLSALPSGMVVIEGQDNRVPEPTSGDFAVFTAIRRERIETNVDDYIDTAFTGSIATTVLTVSAMRFGSIVSRQSGFWRRNSGRNEQSHPSEQELAASERTI